MEPGFQGKDSVAARTWAWVHGVVPSCDQPNLVGVNPAVGLKAVAGNGPLVLRNPRKRIAELVRCP
ncbi:hypothetical protein GCM10010523_08640 [Paenarthrobacter ilicis]